MKLTKILLGFLILTLPLIHGRIFQTLGLDFGVIVSGNFEFTKSIYFNAFSALIYIVFFIEYVVIKKEKILVNKTEKCILITIFTVLCYSTYFSISPFTSLIGDLDKGHTSLLYANLLGLYILLRQIDIKDLKNIVHIALFSGIIASVIAVKELYFPSFDYGALGARAIGSFGHPNYLSGYLVLLLPFIAFIKNESVKYIIFIPFIVTIILCKSVFAIFLSLGYIIYILNPGKKYVKISYVFTLLGITTTACLAIIILYFPEKLHSFLSRFYLWESTLNIFITHPKFLLFGAGAETLPYFFNTHKVPELYIFENFGYSADRPHNFILSILYQFGVLGVAIISYLIYKIITLAKSYPSSEKTLILSIVFLFLLYGIFHYFSISSYMLLILAGALYFHPKQARNYSVKLFFILLIFVSLLGSFSSVRLYAGEMHYKNGEIQRALDMIFHPKYFLKFGETEKAAQLEGIISEKNYKVQISLSTDKIKSCNNLIATYPSPENYFYCGGILESSGEEVLSVNYYNKGLAKLPDLWNQDSEYLNNYFVRNTITGNRFFSPKFGDVRSVLEKVGK